MIVVTELVISGTPCTDIILSIVYGTATKSNENFNSNDIEVDDKLVTRGRSIVIITVVIVNKIRRISFNSLKT